MKDISTVVWILLVTITVQTVLIVENMIFNSKPADSMTVSQLHGYQPSKKGGPTTTDGKGTGTR